MSSQWWCLLIVFSHSSCDFSSWQIKGFQLCYIMRLWISFSLAFYQAVICLDMLFRVKWGWKFSFFPRSADTSGQRRDHFYQCLAGARQVVSKYFVLSANFSQHFAWRSRLSFRFFLFVLDVSPGLSSPILCVEYVGSTNKSWGTHCYVIPPVQQP